MCRYCKNLKSVMELQFKELLSAVNYWKRRDLAARKLLERCSGMILDCSIQDVQLFYDIQRFLR